jgi:SSS family solute:Na+ symporter
MDSLFAFTDSQVHPLDITLIIIYLLGILIFGLYVGKGVKNSSDFFLAGKTLSWWVVGLSIIGSNIGSNDYVGAAGSAYKIGIAQANFEWIGAIPAMILAAFLFIPYYWKSGVVDEFLILYAK